MTNQVLGIVTIVSCCVGFFFSWKYQRKDNYRVAVILLILCGLILRIYSASDFYLHDWDERYHALVAKNFLKHFFVPTLYDQPLLNYNYQYWNTNHIWLHKQPLPLWSIAISLWVFGVNEIAVRIPSILLTTAGIGLTYSIAKYLFNKNIAYLAAFFYCINGLIVEMTGGRVATDHIDIFFLFFVELAVYFTIQYVNKQKIIFNVLVGLSIGAAILSKWLPALIVLPIWLLIVIDSKRFTSKTIITQLILVLVVLVVVFLPWQVYTFQTFPIEAKWEASFNMKHITEVLQDQGGPFYYYLTMIRINYGELIYIPIVWFLWKLMKNPFDLKRWAIAIWFIVPIAFFSIAQTKMQAYILFVSPALFIVSSEFFFWVASFYKNNKFKWVIIPSLSLFIVLPIRYLNERLDFLVKKEINPKWACDLKDFNHKNYQNAVLFNYNKPIEAMFYTNLIVYDKIPSTEIILKLIQNGKMIIINDNGKIPDEIRAIKQVKIEFLTEATN